MRRTVVVVCALFGLAGIARAADLGEAAPTWQHPWAQGTNAYFDWTGAYVGGQIGGGWLSVARLTSGGFANSYTGSGFVGGAHIGYNWMTANGIVWGVELEGNLANIAGNDAGVGGTTDGTRINWDGTLNARLGKAFGRALIYVEGGAAIAGVSQTNSSTALTGPGTLGGWDIGGGIDFALTNDLFGSIGFKHKAYGAASYTGGGLLPFTATTTSQEVTVGLSKKF